MSPQPSRDRGQVRGPLWSVTHWGAAAGRATRRRCPRCWPRARAQEPGETEGALRGWEWGAGDGDGAQGTGFNISICSRGTLPPSLGDSSARHILFLLGRGISADGQSPGGAGTLPTASARPLTAGLLPSQEGGGARRSRTYESALLPVSPPRKRTTQRDATRLPQFLRSPAEGHPPLTPRPHSAQGAAVSIPAETWAPLPSQV